MSAITGLPCFILREWWLGFLYYMPDIFIWWKTHRVFHLVVHDGLEPSRKRDSADSWHFACLSAMMPSWSHIAQNFVASPLTCGLWHTQTIKSPSIVDPLRWNHIKIHSSQEPYHHLFWINHVYLIPCLLDRDKFKCSYVITNNKWWHNYGVDLLSLICQVYPSKPRSIKDQWKYTAMFIRLIIFYVANKIILLSEMHGISLLPSLHIDD